MKIRFYNQEKDLFSAPVEVEKKDITALLKAEKKKGFLPLKNKAGTEYTEELLHTEEHQIKKTTSYYYQEELNLKEINQLVKELNNPISFKFESKTFYTHLKIVADNKNFYAEDIAGEIQQYPIAQKSSFETSRKITEEAYKITRMKRIYQLQNS